MGDKAKDAAKAGADLVRAHPDKVDKAARIIKDVVDPNMPPETVEGQAIVATSEISKDFYNRLKKRNDNKKSTLSRSVWRGR